MPALVDKVKLTNNGAAWVTELVFKTQQITIDSPITAGILKASFAVVGVILFSFSEPAQAKFAIAFSLSFPAPFRMSLSPSPIV